ncbi:hypothetical protein TUM20985_32250 [Mycobacterium antarcticum]|uniref:hypothetical protein n=1 Tax=unclassified Mycolicibacterium TaxID=2636767 RepID=UPI002397C1E3|nr:MULTISPECIES: hypothetical protein [unclassified Mycolicibacterium]BDX32678.1 hypothetical protein TUM20985_32250 [Mycolicibacterium sp. TUM20985]GLP75885.1 hypothetical protein TUM20983_29950 [Mycolicibacterium sp. TUM20983]GLP83771.1 hypothetical protein TUM20984_51910 [Mycolicibacterium sp. TUM20984]
MTIQGDDVRKLLDADEDAILVLIEGRVEVVGPSALHDDAHRGAWEVISRVELLERTGAGSDLADDDVARQAAILDAEVSELGG